MTLIYTKRHVDQLVSELKHEWPKDDPDLQRVADALPLENLEEAYLKKLAALPNELLAVQFALIRQKLLELTKWC